MTWIVHKPPRMAMVAALACGALIGSGCANSDSEYPHADLAGAVTLDGAPVETGRVNFMPAAGTAGQPTSAEINAGRYIAENVPLGNITVTFSITQDTGEMVIEGDREPYPKIISVVPPQYAEGIEMVVSGDNSAQDFNLVVK